MVEVAEKSGEERERRMEAANGYPRGSDLGGPCSVYGMKDSLQLLLQASFSPIGNAPMRSDAIQRDECLRSKTASACRPRQPPTPYARCLPSYAAMSIRNARCLLHA